MQPPTPPLTVLAAALHLLGPVVELGFGVRISFPLEPARNALAVADRQCIVDVQSFSFEPPERPQATGLRAERERHGQIQASVAHRATQSIAIGPASKPGTGPYTIAPALVCENEPD